MSKKEKKQTAAGTTAAAAEQPQNPTPGAPVSSKPDPIEAAKNGPEPETLQQATQTYLDKISFVCSKKAPGDVHAIRGEIERFLALNHGIMREYCVPLHPEVEAHFKKRRAGK